MLKRSVFKASTFLMLLLSVVMVFAACGKMEFKVDFIVDDAVYATINTKGEEVLKMPNDPEKGGYVFDGWYWDKDSWKKPFTANSLLDAPLSGNMSVYAKFSAKTDVNGTQIDVNGFDFVDDKSLGPVYYISLPNITMVYSLSDVVTVGNKSTWSLSTDISGNCTIESKTVALIEGNNIFYILVKDGRGNVKQYTVLLRRRPIYIVSYKSDTHGSIYSTEKVEEGYLANPPEITKTGYSLVSWSYDFSKPIEKNITAAAIYNSNEYNILYNANGGEVSQVEQKVSYDASVILPKPHKNGYSFAGWYWNNQLIEDGKWNIAKDITLFAHWTADKNRIVYDLDGGKNSNLNPEYYFTGSSMVLSEPTKTGYTFLGWTTEAGSLVKNPKIDSTDFGTKKFMACWKVNAYRVIFDANGGNCEQTNSNYVFGQYYELPVPTRNGYKFSGWYYNFVNYESGYWNLAENCTLSATWTPLKYSINYILNGGVNSSENASFYTIEKEISLQSPTREGYSFVGWTSDENGVPIIGLKIEKGSFGVKIFTANWRANTYTISLDANGGVCDIETQDVVFDKVYCLPVPQRVGYAFDGWYLGSQKIVSDTWDFAQNCTFVAMWSANQDTKYTVRHWQQNVVDDNYSLFDEQNLTGISDSCITPKTNTYEGFSSPTNKTVSIAPDCSLVVDYFYKRNSYTVSFVTNGGEPLAPITQKYQSELNIPSGRRSGYIFGGWFEDVELLEEYDDILMTSTNKTIYAWWCEENKPADFVYSIADNCSIGSYKGTSITMWIPSFIGGYTVQEITASAFSNKSELKKVVVPDSVISIGLGAFKGCTSIEEMVLPFVGGSYTSKNYEAVFGYIFGYEAAVVCTDWFSPCYAYYYDAITGERVRSYDTKNKVDNTMVNFRAGNSIEMYSPLDAIWQYSCYNAQHPMGGDCYFMRCYYYGIPISIKNVTITVQTDIPVAAFNNCNFIQSITVPENTQNIGEYAFQNCAATINYSGISQD